MCVCVEWFRIFVSVISSRCRRKFIIVGRETNDYMRKGTKVPFYRSLRTFIFRRTYTALPKMK